MIRFIHHYAIVGTFGLFCVFMGIVLPCAIRFAEEDAVNKFIVTQSISFLKEIKVVADI